MNRTAPHRVTTKRKYQRMTEATGTQAEWKAALAASYKRLGINTALHPCRQRQRKEP